jgi:HEAT repeat protein
MAPLMFCDACTQRLEKGEVTEVPLRVVRQVCRQLDSRDSSVRKCATRKLAQLGDPRSADALDAFLTRVDNNSLDGLRALLNTGDPRAADHLRACVTKYHSPEAMKMLVQTGDEHSLADLGAFLVKHPSYQVLSSLVKVGDQTSVEYVYRALRDHQSWWTTSTSSYDAAESLGAAPDITHVTSWEIDSALLLLHTLGQRLTGDGHLLSVQTASRLAEDPACAHRDAAADALVRYLVKWQLRRNAACRQVVAAAAGRLEQGDAASQARATKLRRILDPA